MNIPLEIELCGEKLFFIDSSHKDKNGRMFYEFSYEDKEGVFIPFFIRDENKQKCETYMLENLKLNKLID